MTTKSFLKSILFIGVLTFMQQCLATVVKCCYMINPSNNKQVLLLGYKYLEGSVGVKMLFNNNDVLLSNANVA